MGGQNSNPSSTPNTGSQTPNTADTDQNSLFGQNPIVNNSLKALFNSLKNVQPGTLPGSAPVSQVQLNPNPMGTMPAPSTKGNYPQTSLVRRGQFGSNG